MGVRLATAFALVLFAAAAEARNVSKQMHIGAHVISSARLQARATGAGVEVRYSSFGANGSVLVHQVSGAPVTLGESLLPREADAAVLVPQGALPLQGSGAAVVVVTLFPDGAPPAVR